MVRTYCTEAPGDVRVNTVDHGRVGGVAAELVGACVAHHLGALVVVIVGETMGLGDADLEQSKA